MMLLMFESSSSGTEVSVFHLRMDEALSILSPLNYPLKYEGITEGFCYPLESLVLNACFKLIRH